MTLGLRKNAAVDRELLAEYLDAIEALQMARPKALQIGRVFLSVKYQADVARTLQLTGQAVSNTLVRLTSKARLVDALLGQSRARSVA